MLKPAQALCLKLVQDFSSFPIFIVFWGRCKITNVSIGAKIVSTSVRVSKHVYFRFGVHFRAAVLYVD